MAKQFEEFKKTWATVQPQVTHGLEEIKKNAALIAQTTGVMKAGVKEMGLRIQELKDKGNKGTKIGDFMADAEVKKMMGSIQSYYGQLNTELTRMDGVHKGTFKTTKDAFWKLKKDLTAEIADRKKQVTTKVGTGNKSLPDMEKLLVEITKYVNEEFATFDSFTPEESAQHKKELDMAIDDEIKQSKAQALTAFQAEMDQQALNIRVLTGNFNRAKALYTTVMTECANAEKAFNDSKEKELMTAKANVVAPNKELADMADKYVRAQQDPWIMSKLNDSKDKSKIETSMKAIINARTQASAAIKKLANFRL